MAMQQLPLPGEIVKKSNALARARWQPESIWEPRLVALVASKVHQDDKDFQTYRIPVAELVGPGIDDKNLDGRTYQKIRKAILHLAKATILIAGEKNPRNFMAYPIFAKCGYEDGYLLSGFHPDLKPHFLNLKKQFTEFSLMEYLLLPSGYSQSLFEFLKSWANLPSREITFSVVELHELLSTPPSFRENFKAFRIRVLEKAHKDIIKHTGLRYEWEPINIGKTVVEIRFIFPGAKMKSLKKKQTSDAKGKTSKNNNELGLAAFVCAKDKNGNCVKKDNKKAVCEICQKLDYCGEIQKRRNTH